VRAGRGGDLSVTDCIVNLIPGQCICARVCARVCIMHMFRGGKAGLYWICIGRGDSVCLVWFTIPRMSVSCRLDLSNSVI
jgi:hypothetical protein